jgi:quinol monooxygenase YgiN
MWAQLIEMQLKPGEDVMDVMAQIRDAEQPGSGLVRSVVMRDQADADRVVTLVIFESEEHARAREQDPRRQERLAPAQATMAGVMAGPPSFTDLDVVAEWTGTTA